MVAVVFHTARLIFKHLLCDAVQFPFITEGIATFVSLHRMSKYIAAFVPIQIVSNQSCIKGYTEIMVVSGVDSKRMTFAT